MAESNKKTFEKITEQEIKANGIQALANRPNKVSQYGKSGLSAAELKKWFDNLTSLIANRVNGIASALEGDNAARYIDVNFSTIETLYDLVQSIQNGSFVDGELKIKISEALAQNGLEVDDTVTLQRCLEELFSDLFNKFDDLEDDIQNGSLAEKLKINNAELNSLGKKYLDDIIDKILQLLRRKAELTLKDLLIVPDQPIDYVYGDGGTPMLDFETGEFCTTFEPRAAINSNFADERYAREIHASYDDQNGTLTVSLFGKNESGATKEISKKTIDLPLERSIVSIDEKEKDGKPYLVLTLASGSTTEIELDDIFSGLTNNIKDGAGNGSLSQKPLPSSSGSYSFNFSTGNPHWKDTGITPTEGDGIFSANDAEEAIEARVTGLGAAVVNTRSAATGKNAFAAGTKSWARKESDTALGNNNLANGGNSLATGNETVANAPQAASFNYKTYAGANNSFAINNTTAAMADDSFTHGALTETTGIRSRAGGYNSKANAPISFAEGDSCEAGGESSAAINHHTVTNKPYQTAVGTFNKAEDDALFMVGNGDWSTRKNAFVVKKDGRASVGADGVEDNDVATVAQINDLQSQINTLHPPVMEYISMMPYLEENDATNINLLLQKGKKFHFTGNWRTTNLYEDYGELPWEVVEAFGCVNFAWEWTPDTVPSFNGGGNAGNISNFTASLDYTGYTLISASASRMMVSFGCYDDGNGGYSVSVDCELAIEVVIKEDSTGTEYTCTYGYIYWDYHKNEYYEGRGDGCLNYVESYIEKTPETAHFFPNTYDFRTQALDRRLAVALEENRARIAEAFKNKYNGKE